MTENKITKKTMFAKILSFIEVSEIDNKELYTDFLKHEIELLNKKSASRKPTAQQEDNKVLTDILLDILQHNADKWFTIAEIQDKSLSLQTYNDKPVTNQRISALLKKLIENGEVERKEEKRKAYFKAVVAIEDLDTFTVECED